MTVRKSETHYSFPMVEAKVCGIVTWCDEDIEMKVMTEKSKFKLDERHGKCGVILNQTTFYSEAGGQDGDVGKITGPRDSVFIVEDCQKLDSGHVLHIGRMTSGFLMNGIRVKTRIDTAHRIACMQNHTAVHLLNSVLHSILPITSQKSSHVSSSHFRHDFSVYGSDFDVATIAQVESQVNQMIGDKGNVDLINVTDIAEAEKILKPAGSWSDAPESQLKLITLPGETYPSKLRLVKIPNGVSEPCCGSHVDKVEDIQAFAIISCKSPSTGVKSLRCVTGVKAENARNAGIEILERVLEINDLAESLDSTEEALSGDGRQITNTNLLKEVKRIQNFLETATLKYGGDDFKSVKAHLIPYTVRCEVDPILNDLSRHLKSVDRSSVKSRMADELEEALEDQTHLGFVVHAFEERATTKVQLSKLTSKVKDKPILLLNISESGQVAGRAVVPEGCPFTAESWLSSVVAESLGPRCRQKRVNSSRQRSSVRL